LPDVWQMQVWVISRKRGDVAKDILCQSTLP
jgi:hypothetical protein